MALIKRKLKKGTCWYIIRNYRDKDGNPCVERIMTIGIVHASEARIIHAQWERKQRNSNQLLRSNVSFRLVLKEYLKYVEDNQKNKNAKKVTKLAINKIPDWYDCDINNVNIVELHKMQDAMATGISARSANIYSVEIKKIFKFAMNMGYCSSIPHHKRFQEKYDDKNITNYLSDDTIIETLIRANHKQRITIYFMLELGLRRQEFFRLNLKDFDFEKRTVTIPDSSKNKRGRIIPIPKKSTLFDVLLYYRKDFECRDGRICQYSCIDSLTRELRKVGIKPRDIRKTFGTNYAKKNLPQYALQRIMGHTDFKTTSKFYIDVDADYLREQLDALG